MLIKGIPPIYTLLMKFISLNCNGIRSSLEKGLADYIRNTKPDFICFQETKANQDQVPPSLWEEGGYTPVFHSAEKKGYSGVAVLYKKTPEKIIIGIGDPFFDKEGRSIYLEYPNFALWNLYFPSGTTGDIRQAAKMKFLDLFQKESSKRRKKQPNIIVCGDVNIAHTPQDIHDPKGNAKSSGFLPEEREWLSEFLNKGWVDTFRYLYPDKQEYSWWTFRAGARAKNKGWRIDYFFVTEELKKNVKSHSIFRDKPFSDHAPLEFEIKL
ncbi:exodeoxyribonuclease III [Leptospira interrogans serovar Djasiman str. LT1649]|nr:exodeoxyribonuclease III [Leptospira interrogans serovar Djasiman str. LT1649]